MMDPVPLHELLLRLRERGTYGVGAMVGRTGPLAIERLRELDARATQIRAYSPRLIPGLLQTYRYALQTINQSTPALPLDEAEHRTDLRVQRTEAFLQRWWELRKRASASFIIGEAAFVHPVTAAHVHVEQIRWLLEIIQTYDNIRVRILPFDQPPAADSPFSIHEIEGGAPFCREEGVMRGWWACNTEDVARCYSVWDSLSKAARSPSDSRAYLEERLEWIAGKEQSSSSPATATRSAASPWPAPRPAQ